MLPQCALIYIKMDSGKIWIKKRQNQLKPMAGIFAWFLPTE